MKRVLAGTLVTAALLFQGCTQVVDTRQFTSGYARVGDACATPFGAYFLPKALIKVEAERKQDTGISITVSPEKFVADPTQPACLDYLESFTSDDVVKIKRSEDGLLEGVSSFVVDRTPDIAIKFANVARNAAITRFGGPTPEVGEKASFAIDPFDQARLFAVNKSLRRFGACIYVEGYSFDPAHATPQGWCSLDKPTPYFPPSAAMSYLSEEERLHSEGILYRPNIAHKIVIMRKADPGRSGGWRLEQIKRIDMPNVSPVFALKIQRTLFATNRTQVSFNRGVLADIRVEKYSELKQLSAVVLAYAQAAVAIPAQIVKFQIADTQAQAQILHAEALLLQSTIDYYKAVSPPAAPPPSAASTRFGSCLNGEGPPDECQRLATGVPPR